MFLFFLCLLLCFRDWLKKNSDLKDFKSEKYKPSFLSMSQSLDLLKNITFLYFWCKIQVLLYIQMKSASHTSIITALKFTCCSSLSVSYQQIIVLYIGHCITICGPEFQRTSVIAYSCFCLLYKCFSFMRRTRLTVGTTALSSMETTDWGI